MYSSSVEDTDVKSLSSRSMINNEDVIIAGPVRGIIVGPRAPDSYEKINGAAFFSPSTAPPSNASTRQGIDLSSADLVINFKRNIIGCS